MYKITTKDGAGIYYKNSGTGQPIVFSQVDFTEGAKKIDITGHLNLNDPAARSDRDGMCPIACA